MPELCPVDSVEYRNRFIGVSPSDLGLAYFWRDARELVRFPWCDPRKNFDTFCFYVLCEHCAFTTEQAFLTNHGSYRAAAVHEGILDTYDKLQLEYEKHCKYVFASATLTSEHMLSAYNLLFDAEHPPNCTRHC